jgi:Ca-activated chloride channel family protein
MKASNLILIFALCVLLTGCSDGLYNDSGVVATALPADQGSEDVTVENPFVDTRDEPTSTFSIDADGASYARARRYIMQEGVLPPASAIRTEEFINYFNLEYPFDAVDHPISLNGEISSCPWATDHKLVRIGIKGQPLGNTTRPPANYVLLIDVSGSMSGTDRIGLLKEGFKTVVDEMSSRDRVAIVTYSGSTRVHLESTAASNKARIKDAIGRLSTGGGTNGEGGIIAAYDIAIDNFIEGGNNRIIVGTDGDFNVGVSSQEELVKLIEEKRDLGVFLTIVGVGSGNFRDGQLEQMANHGNGTYEYVDKLEQVEKVFLHEYDRLFTVAKDVKVQVTFDTTLIQAYRLIGYENRVLQNEDFVDDSKDAGEIGANQSITALYEVVPVQQPEVSSSPSLTVDFRYKMPDEDVSMPLELQITDRATAFSASSDFMKFTASVAAFGMTLIESDYAGTADHDRILSWLSQVQLDDPHGFKAELEDIVRLSKSM